MSQPNAYYFSCPACGAPLTEKLQKEGKERCLFCDVVSIYQDQSVQLESGKKATTVQKSVGLIKRYGTIVLAPFLGWSALTLLNVQRIVSYSEEPMGVTLIVGGCVLTLMLLGRWVFAGIWTLFMCLALVSERVLAAQELAPIASFSYTSEETIMPISIAFGFLVVFVIFWVSRRNVLEHEQQKIRWRSSVAIVFLFGVIGGFRYYAEPLPGEIYRSWSWAYALEMQALTELRTQLEAKKPQPKTIAVEIRPTWAEYDPKGSNTIFIPKQAIDMLPSQDFFLLSSEETLWLKGLYVDNLEMMSNLNQRRAYFSELHEDWRAQIEIFRANWMVVYEYNREQKILRFWLIKKVVKQPAYEIINTLEIMAYRETQWKRVPASDDENQEAAWIFAELKALTQGSFQLSSN